MKIIIIGCGKVGRSAAAALSAENHDVVVVDNRPERIFNLANELDVLAVAGGGLSHDTLQEAGVSEADLVIALTGHDELNLLCCLLAGKLGASHTIARVRNPEYTQYFHNLSMDLGIDLIINPEMEAAREIFRSLSLPYGVSSEALSVKNAEIFKLKIHPDSVLCNMPVKDIPARLKSDILVGIVERGDQTFIPDGEFVLQARDTISIVGSVHNIHAFFSKIRLHANKIRNVMVVGAGKVAYYLANMLKQTHMQLTMIESNLATCEHMAETFPEFTIIHGNGSDEDLLIDEGLRDMDVFVSLTGIDEENIILSLYASSTAGIKTITKINRIAFDNVIAAMDLDTIVNPKKLTLERIIKYVRAAAGGVGSNVESVHQLAGNTAEGLEFNITRESEVTNVPLAKLKLKPGILVAMILRRGKAILPRGNDTIQVGDHVILVTTHKGLCDIEQILAGGRS